MGTPIIATRNMKRKYPICGHRFQGKGWDGIDAHWRSKHDSVHESMEIHGGPEIIPAGARGPRGRAGVSGDPPPSEVFGQQTTGQNWRVAVISRNSRAA